MKDIIKTLKAHKTMVFVVVGVMAVIALATLVQFL
jgi:hypothetical protein